MYSLLTRLWEWCRLGRLILSVVAGLTVLSRATLLTATPGRTHGSGTARPSSRPIRARGPRGACRTRAAARVPARGGGPCPGPAEPSGTRPRPIRRSRAFPRTAGDAAVVPASGMTSGDTNTRADTGDVPVHHPHPLAPSIRRARHTSPRIPWRHPMDAVGSRPFDPRDQGADRIR